MGDERLNLWDDYGVWLVKRVGFKNPDYTKLMAKLHDLRFFYSIERDQNRAMDGLNLRGEFAKEKRITIFQLDHSCSVLEMLVGLAIRVESEYIGDPREEHPEHFFWEMIMNLGVGKYNNRRWNERSEIVIERVVNRWLRREFSANGNGSIFPISNPLEDQRKIEIWLQMNEYLTENYPI